MTPTATMAQAEAVWHRLGWPTGRVRKALAVCALAPELDDIAAWEALAACNDKLERHVWQVRQSGLIDASGAAMWRVRHDVRQLLCGELQWESRQAVHTALKRYYEALPTSSTTPSQFALRLLRAYHSAAAAEFAESGNEWLEDYAPWDDWLELEQEIRVGGDLGGQYELARLSQDLEDTRQIATGRPEVVFMRAMYLYSARRYMEAARLFLYLNSELKSGRMAGIGRHCLGRLVWSGYAQPPGAANRVQAAEGLYRAGLRMLKDERDAVGACLVACSLAELMERTGRASVGASILAKEIEPERLPRNLRIGYFLTRGTVALSSLRESKNMGAVATKTREAAETDLEAAWVEADACGSRKDRMWVLLALARAARKRREPEEALRIVDRAAQEVLGDRRKEAEVANQRGWACLDLARTVADAVERQRWQTEAERAFSCGLDEGEVWRSVERYQRYGLATALCESRREEEALRQLTLLLKVASPRDTGVLMLVADLVTKIATAPKEAWADIHRRLSWAMTAGRAKGYQFSRKSIDRALAHARERAEGTPRAAVGVATRKKSRPRKGGKDKDGEQESS